MNPEEADSSYQRADAETPIELTDSVSVILASVLVTVMVPFIVVNVEKEHGTSVALPEPDGPRSTLACVGRMNPLLLGIRQATYLPT